MQRSIMTPRLLIFALLTGVCVAGSGWFNFAVAETGTLDDGALYDGISTAQLKAELRRAGLMPQGAKDRNFRVLQSKGLPFEALLQNCTLNLDMCTTVTFRATFDMVPAEATDIALRYNQKYVFSRAWFSEKRGALILDYSIETSGGITEGNFRANVRGWLMTLKDIVHVLPNSNIAFDDGRPPQRANAKKRVTGHARETPAAQLPQRSTTPTE